MQRLALAGCLSGGVFVGLGLILFTLLWDHYTDDGIEESVYVALAATMVVGVSSVICGVLLGTILVFLFEATSRQNYDILR
ncbi:transmembrane domain-containing protein [Noumeavirus]|uniref:transmembrane domain-containing protein n=1 Tax=Noumeavirus TaxID=1955558 RepID=UPI000982D9A5|nr:transmembrane domain-containing protein [Noumeavirus]AQM73334.1 transmembrane domain-containing protein [Noumeavirus]